MFLIGKKLKMSQIWEGDKATAVTVVEVGPNTVSVVRSKDQNGYEAIQLSSGRSKKEFRTEGIKSEFKVGDTIDLSAFNEGEKVKVTGVSKGRGFQGVVKRHGFRGGPKTHGQKNRFRAPGSIGSTAFQRVVPGRRMAGRMGSETVSVKNLKIAKIDKEKQLLYLEGAVPGSRGSLLVIRRS